MKATSSTKETLKDYFRTLRLIRNNQDAIEALRGKGFRRWHSAVVTLYDEQYALERDIDNLMTSLNRNALLGYAYALRVSFLGVRDKYEKANWARNYRFRRFSTYWDKRNEYTEPNDIPF